MPVDVCGFQVYSLIEPIEQSYDIEEVAPDLRPLYNGLAERANVLDRLPEEVVRDGSCRMIDLHL